MHERLIGAPASGILIPGAGAGGACPVERVRMGRFICHFAYPLEDEERRTLIAALRARARGRAPAVNGSVLGGRAATWRHEIPSVGSVHIKEYRRGGMLRVIRRRHYLRFRAARPEREFHSLRTARAAGLNVPEPVACFTRGELFYRGWLATRFIPGRSLLEVVAAEEASIPALMADLTRQVGLLIEHRFAHVDLHPGNVLVDAAGALYLLDFDRATVFTRPLEELRQQYDVRWRRAVDKHGLPGVLGERFSAGLRSLNLSR
ncbi:MAG: lipopolysaccharide kinase InaA family protein [Vicinamibacterales bacterium]